MTTRAILLASAVFALSWFQCIASDPSLLQDFCVVDKMSKGSLYVGFVTSNPDNKLFTKVLNKGDVFVFPEGLIHFQFNYGTNNAVAIAALSSQNPGVITVANAVFGSKPSISDDVLAKAFQVDKKTIDRIQAQF
ncbi:hypothetical protein EJB05_21644, partial [Eragrostis curvula]